MIIRLFLIIFGLYIAIRLIKIVVNTVRAFKTGSVGSVPRAKKKGEVGKGWIVDDEEGEDDENDT